MLGVVDDACQRPELGDAAGVHHRDLVRRLRDDPEVVRDEDDGGAVLRLELADEVEDLRLDGDVERGRRLVGDQHLGVEDERHRDHHALPHPAGELVGIAREPVGGIRDPDLPEPLEGAGARRLLRHALVGLDRLDDLPADRVERMQRRERVLKDHGDALAAHATQVVPRQAQQVDAVEQHLPGDRRVREARQAHHGERGDALPGT